MHKRARRAARAAMVSAAPLPIILCCGTAMAQQAPAAAPTAQASELQEVVVTGYRASVQSALDSKRTAIQPIDSVAAEDLGKMPDQNVAESLERLPGVSINRSGGKGTQVLIDGLGNNLITLNGEVLLTGREIYVSGEASGGADADIQYASLEGIPSEEIGGIDVIKNPTAQNREGGFGGIIDIKTRSPLAQDMGLNLAGNLQGTKAESADGGPTPVGSLVGGFKFSDSFAITGSVSYDDDKTHDQAIPGPEPQSVAGHEHGDQRRLRRQPDREHQQHTARRPDLHRSAARLLQRHPRPDRNQGRDPRRRMEVERQHHQRLQLVLHRRRRSEHHLFEQGVVLRRQRRDQPAGRAGFLPGHRSDPAVFDRRQRRDPVGARLMANGAETATLYEANNDQGQQLPVHHPLRRHGR